MGRRKGPIDVKHGRGSPDKLIPDSDDIQSIRRWQSSTLLRVLSTRDELLKHSAYKAIQRIYNVVCGHQGAYLIQQLHVSLHALSEYPKSRYGVTQVGEQWVIKRIWLRVPFATVLVLECRVDYRWHGLTFSIAYERVLYVFQVGSDFLEAFAHSLSSMRVSKVKQVEEGMKDSMLQF